MRVLSLLLVMFVAAPLAHAKLDVTITEGVTGALPIAVVPFGLESDLDTDIAAIVEADLERSGLFRALPREEMLERPTAPGDVDYRNWRAVGVEHLVIGRLRRDPFGQLALRFHLLDVFRGAQTEAYDILIPDGASPRAIAHQTADFIFERLTGVPGIFSTQIAYVAGKGPLNDRSYELIIADADGENARTIARSREPLMSPAWSPDRRRLAYVSFDNGRSVVFIQELATGKLTRVISERGINGAPAWSPDGTRLAVTLSYEKNADIYVIDLESGSRRRLTDHWAIDTEPSWAPDGRSLVFTSDRGGKPQIYSVDLGGGTPKRVSFDGEQNLRASYSPDGRSLLLVNYADSRYRIGLLDLKTQQLKILSNGPLDESPSFAPNGAVVIYAAAGDAGAELATVTVDGRVRQRLRQEVGDVREPAWSPYAR